MTSPDNERDRAEVHRAGAEGLASVDQTTLAGLDLGLDWEEVQLRSLAYALAAAQVDMAHRPVPGHSKNRIDLLSILDRARHSIQAAARRRCSWVEGGLDLDMSYEEQVDCSEM